MTYDIVVIGAGAAGIAAARHLRQTSSSCLVLEAGNEIGGRCRTDHATFATPVDLGAHWLHSPTMNPLVSLADHYGVRYRPAGYASAFTHDGRRLNEVESDAVTDFVEACFARVAGSREDKSVTDCLGALPPSPWRSVFEAEFLAKQGAATSESSALDFARYVWEGDDLPLVDGFGTLLDRLAADLPIRRGAAVSRVDWSGAREIRLTTDQGIVAAKAAIVTVSTGVLAEGIRFDPPLPEWKRRAIEGLPMGHCNKIVLKCDCPLSDPSGGEVILPIRDGSESVELVLPGGSPHIVACLVNGPFARDLARAGHTAMRDFAVERLTEIFGHGVRSNLSPLSILADWDADSHVRGCYAYARPGSADARAALAEPIDQRLFFAGEATSPRFMGDAHGAWLSGLAAAEAAVAASAQ